MLYPAEMDSILRTSGVDTVKIPFGAPNANARAERYMLNCKKECLNHLLIFGLNRLQHVVDCIPHFLMNTGHIRELQIELLATVRF